MSGSHDDLGSAQRRQSCVKRLCRCSSVQVPSSDACRMSSAVAVVAVWLKSPALDISTSIALQGEWREVGLFAAKAIPCCTEDQVFPSSSRLHTPRDRRRGRDEGRGATARTGVPMPSRSSAVHPRTRMHQTDTSLTAIPDPPSHLSICWNDGTHMKGYAQIPRHSIPFKSGHYSLSRKIKARRLGQLAVPSRPPGRAHGFCLRVMVLLGSGDRSRLDEGRTGSPLRAL